MYYILYTTPNKYVYVYVYVNTSMQPRLCRTKTVMVFTHLNGGSLIICSVFFTTIIIPFSAVVEYFLNSIVSHTKVQFSTL